MTEQRFARLQIECRRIINALRQRYRFAPSDCDDLEQEMAVALLELDGQTDSFCLSHAAWAAVNWLRGMYGRRECGRERTVGNPTRLIDRGGCRRVWC